MQRVASSTLTQEGPWSQTEVSYHINCLEMLAAFLALQCFTRNTPRYMDNNAAISYLNLKGWTTSSSLCMLAKQTWQWCMSQNISLVANHLLGHLNSVADRESRVALDRWDWQLHPKIFTKISHLWGPLTIDLFASRLAHQLPVCFSWRLDPQASRTDAFLQDWLEKICYANPPWGLLLKVLLEISHQQAKVKHVARRFSWAVLLRKKWTFSPY